MLNIFSPFEKTSNIARSEKRVKAGPEAAMIRKMAVCLKDQARALNNSMRL